MPYAPLARTDHIQRGLSRLIAQFQEKPRIDALIRPWLRQIQRLENAAWEVINLRGIDDREGVGLDLLGAIVGRGRSGLSDEDYRLAIRAQIRINRSSGSTEDVIAVGILSLPDGTYWEYSEQYPAGILVTLPSPTLNPSILFESLRRAKLGGVRLQLIWGPPQLNSWLILSNNTNSVDTAHGFGDATQYPIGPGGGFSHVYSA